MKSKNKIILIFIISIFIFSCSSIKITPHNSEDIFLFKAETRLLNLEETNLIEKFVSYANTEITAKNKSINSCEQKLIKLNNEKFKCEFFGYSFTEYGNTVIDM